MQYDPDEVGYQDENERLLSETHDVSDLTNQVLKICNVVRDKNWGSKILYGRSGKIAGAR